MTSYLLAGGGTAGHINPLLACADRLRAEEADAGILVLGTAEGLEARLVPSRGYQLLTIPRLPFPRRPNVAALRFPARWLASVRKTRQIIKENRVDVVVGFGGYAAAPAYAAAHREGVPLVIHEANARPGIANRYGARYALSVGVGFSGTRIRGAQLVGLPLRRELETLDRAALREEALAFFGFSNAPTLLVTGGSLGATRLNTAIARGVGALRDAGWQVLHIAGERWTKKPPDIAGYRVLRYCERMDFAFAVADMVVSRAGAATVSELAALGIPTIFVPYPLGNGEQALNARGAVRAGGALLLEDAEFTEEWVRGELSVLLRDRARIAEMAARMAETGIGDGTARMVALIRQAARTG